MMKFVTALCAALIAAVAYVGTASDASARCGNCGPIKPVYHYRTVNKVMHKTRYRDVSRTSYVHRTRRIYNITRVRPIVRVHTVTRVHHYQVPVVHNAYFSSTQYLPARTISTGSVRNYYHGCGCR